MKGFSRQQQHLMAALATLMLSKRGLLFGRISVFSRMGPAE